jgi:hypothetical protein
LETVGTYPTAEGQAKMVAAKAVGAAIRPTGTGLAALETTGFARPPPSKHRKHGKRGKALVFAVFLRADEF